MQEITAFSTLSDMKAILEGMGTDFFDTVAYDDEAEPTKIVCTQDGHTILEVSKSSTNWTFTPFIADGAGANTYHCFNNSPISSMYRFSGGLCIADYMHSPRKFFAIGKTSANKTGFVAYSTPQSIVVKASSTYYPTSFGDTPDLWIYTDGYIVQTNSATADRTILSKLPIVGARGSTDAFTSIFVRNAVQFAEDGQQMIGGQLYGCVKFLAFTDDE